MLDFAPLSVQLVAVLGVVISGFAIVRIIVLERRRLRPDHPAPVAQPSPAPSAPHARAS